MQGWQVGIDIGGTFTDVVAYRPGDGSTRMAKVESRPDDPISSLLAGLQSLGITWDAVDDLNRALDLAPVWEGPFTDIEGVGGHQSSINAVAAAGISNGCGADVYCPEDGVTRAQMASFLARAFIWVDESPGPAE